MSTENYEKCRKALRGGSQRYILKSPDMNLPADMQSFLMNVANLKRYSIL